MYDDYIKQISEAKTFEKGNRITDGAYLWEVLGLKMEKKRNGVMFIAELVCRESRAVTVDPSLAEAGERIELIKPISVGEKVGYIQNMNSDSAFSNVKDFMLGLDGSDPKAVNQQEFASMLSLALSDKQPFRGALVRSQSYRQKIKAPKGPDKTIFLGHNWTFVEQTVEEINGRAAALNKAA